VTFDQALRHPNWSMGTKVTIDSSTLFNKGLEVIEAQWLFNVPYDAIDVLVHPEQHIHSFVEFTDGSVIAQLGSPDMRLPIQYALTWPDRVKGPAKRLDFAALSTLSFESPDIQRFPALRIAIEAGRAGGTTPTVLSAVDDVAVDAFANGRITWMGIARLLETILARHVSTPVTSIGDVMEADAWARAEARTLISQR
jgi:1-deoxy-D-xylulose-5-phosphate reductoisomerase